MKHPAASGGVSGAKTAKYGTAIRLAMHRLQVPPQGAGNLPTAIKKPLQKRISQTFASLSC